MPGGDGTHTDFRAFWLERGAWRDRLIRALMGPRTRGARPSLLWKAQAGVDVRLGAEPTDEHCNALGLRFRCGSMPPLAGSLCVAPKR